MDRGRLAWHCCSGLCCAGFCSWAGLANESLRVLQQLGCRPPLLKHFGKFRGFFWPDFAAWCVHHFLCAQSTPGLLLWCAVLATGPAFEGGSLTWGGFHVTREHRCCRGGPLSVRSALEWGAGLLLVGTLLCDWGAGRVLSVTLRSGTNMVQEACADCQNAGLPASLHPFCLKAYILTQLSTQTQHLLVCHRAVVFGA